ncbi:endonuclease/exonuclease/phosphatase family protein [Streptomyces sp. NPDC048825]|uniref:endonuclease/exonuclease/phosphatase family protein n=1 Tax=Streptomyces sp. NPDC048825 TaxID=3365592 RepID=UPI003722E91E
MFGSQSRDNRQRSTGRTRTRTARAAATALALGLLGTSAFTSTSVAATADSAVSRNNRYDLGEIGTFNMAGGNVKRSIPEEVWEEEEDTYTGQHAVDALYRSIADHQPAFLTVQEACGDWMDELAEKLPTYTISFDPVKTGSGADAQCYNPIQDENDPGYGGPDRNSPRSLYGNAMITKNTYFGTGATAKSHSLGTPSGEQREMLCVTSNFLSTAACSAHTTSARTDQGADYRDTEIANAVNILETEYAGYVHFLGGDFNAEPLDNEMKQIYSSRYSTDTTGRYGEVDSPCETDTPPTPGPACLSGGATTLSGEKFDYIFLTRGVVEVNSAGPTKSLYSDHLPLWASLTITF